MIVEDYAAIAARQKQLFPATPCLDDNTDDSAHVPQPFELVEYTDEDIANLLAA